jgi:DNA-binding SARP family transcriptional activator
LAGLSASLIPAADRAKSPAALRLQILGALRLWRGDQELDPGPRQQAALLAVLLACPDQLVSRSTLIDLLWDSAPPATALNVIHKYIGALRRVLEPDLSARATGSFLRRRADGYLFESRGSGLDLSAFRELITAARQAADLRQPQVSLDRFVDALRLWRGSAGTGTGLGSRAASVFAALDGEFFDACLAAADLATRLRQPQRVLPAVRLAASMAPLDEALQASLVTLLDAAGQRTEALATSQEVRSRLAEELGIDAGPALRMAQQRILTESAAAVSESGPAGGLIGRDAELDRLRQAARSALAGGAGVVIVDGEPGVGKTRLLKEVSAQAESWGALAVWGMCLGDDGTPSMWPWVRLVDAILQAQPADERAQWLAGELGRLVGPRSDGGDSRSPDGGARFRLFEQVVALVSRAASRRPAIIIVDDLHWADEASLQLFSHLSGRLPGGALIVAALRDRAPRPGTELSRHLAAVSRSPGHHRFRLGALRPREAAELVRREIGTDPGAEAIRGIYARTAGNPFFVQELARLFADTGSLATRAADASGVPPTVRDVVRARTADLGDDEGLLLQIAALMGREVGIPLLARAAGTDIATCLDRLEPLAALGVLEQVPGEPYWFHFPHDLVRESVAEVLPPRRANELHLRIAEALEAVSGEDDSVAERIAFHLWMAGPLADPARTVEALIRAGSSAARKSALEAAERHLRSAVRVARTSGLAELELSAVAPLADVCWKQGKPFASYTDLLVRAENVAHDLGQDAKAADFLYMRVVGAFTHHHPDTELLMQRLIHYSETSPDPTARAYALYIQARHAYERGNVAAALRYMSDDGWTVLDDARWRHNPLGDLRIFAPLFRPLLTAMHGDVGTARALLKAAAEAAGDDPYAIAVWSLWATFAAEWAGDPAWALDAIERWRTADPHHFFVNLDPPMRVAQCWARALTGDDPAIAAAAAAEAEQVVVTTMLDPPRFGVTRDYALLAEMFVAAGMPGRAGAALDHADRLARLHDEPSAEPLRLLVRAKVVRARGEPDDVVLAAVERAKAAATASGTYIVGRRADELLSG